MKIISLILLAFTLSPYCFASQSQSIKPYFENVLKPFSTDGCSQFPDSVVGMDYEECCLDHDYAYWKGGTFEQKQRADEQLGQCVGTKSFSALGSMMEMGVGIGGSASLPTNWRWG